MHGKSVSQWLDALPETRAIAHHAQRLLDLQQVLLETAPRSIAQTCTVCGLRAGTLVVSVDNGATAQKFRLISPQLLKRIREDFQEVNEIQCHVQGRSTLVLDKPTGKRAKLSQSTLTELDKLAASLPDSDLKSAVMRMAARHRRPGD